MQYNNQIEVEAALNRGREYVLRMSGLSKRQLKYDMNYVWEIIAPGQESAYDACKLFVEKYSGCLSSIETNGIILVGAVGCGKTMLASFIIHYLIHFRYSDRKLVCLSEDYFDDDFESYRFFSIGNPSKFIMLNTSYFLSDLRNYIEYQYEYNIRMTTVKKADVLILDDLGTEKSTEWTKSVLFEIIDYRYNNNLPMIITTNCLPEELREKIGERSVDRLREMCRLVTIDHGSFRQTVE